MPGLEVVFSRDQIADAVRTLAARISADYAGKEPLVVGVLKGSFIFMADLIRALTVPVKVEFVRLASYGSGRDTSGEVSVVQPLGRSIKGEDVLVVEDIVDRGLTLNLLLEQLRADGPASLRLCALLDKASRRRVPVQIDYLGFAVSDRFLVGYGLDWAERYRHLPDIHAVVD
jgi:hypoxanthine phosphoribosyltransferase